MADEAEEHGVECFVAVVETSEEALDGILSSSALAVESSWSTAPRRQQDAVFAAEWLIKRDTDSLRVKVEHPFFDIMQLLGNRRALWRIGQGPLGVAMCSVTVARSDWRNSRSPLTC
ncbi:MAG: hypothetical protein OXH38_03155 [Chloroflexi bacterium]|nr:hypothetical protein [Chloroflexota bacterium]